METVSEKLLAALGWWIISVRFSAMSQPQLKLASVLLLLQVARCRRVSVRVRHQARARCGCNVEQRKCMKKYLVRSTPSRGSFRKPLVQLSYVCLVKQRYITSLSIHIRAHQSCQNWPYTNTFTSICNPTATAGQYA